MAHPLDEVIRAVVDPVMRDAGFTRRGRRFWLAAERGSVALAEFHATGDLGDGVVRFVVVSGVMPGAWSAQAERLVSLPPGMVGTYMLRTALFTPPPAAFAGSVTPETDPVWGLRPGPEVAEATALQDVVQRDAAKLAELLRSPQVLIDRVLAANASEEFVAASPLWAALALITEGRFDEARTLVEAWALEGPAEDQRQPGYFEDLIEHWRSLGCSRAPGDWQKYVKSAG